MANHRIKQDADLEFRRGLEELVRGHIDDCMTNFSSCSSAVAGEDEDESSPSATERRRRRSALDSDDLAESSAAACRHSRILGRWVARQAEEMITTMERRNRESELMALAGLHTVSMLDPSFLREPRRSRSRSPSNVERPTEPRASRILQMWRELEDMSMEQRSAVNSVGGDRIRTDDVSESDETGYFDEDRRSSREQSPDLGDERERERVREIVSRISETTGSRVSNPNIAESPRSEWLGETERERVRLVREWVQMASEQRDGRRSRREEERDQRSRDGSVTDHEEGQPEHVRRDLLRIRGRQARLDLIMRMVRERERELQGLEEQRAVSEFPHRNRIQALLRGRFLRNGNATPNENERPPSVAARELGQLRQRHPVSGLREAFRFRLENIVRVQASSQAESLISHNINTARNDQSEAFTAVMPPNDNHESQLRNESGDNHQNTQVNAVPELEINRPNDAIDWQESVTQEENWQGVEHERREWQQSTEAGFSDWHDETAEGSDGNWQENIEQDWSGEIPEDEDGDDNHLPGVPEWHGNDSHETLENWEEEPPDPPRVQHSIPTRRVNRFIPPDDDNVYSMELRELLSRRSVSNLLSSGFRESLDQLIESYVQRQVHAPLDWDLQGSLPTPALPEENLIQQSESNQDQQDSAVRPPLVIPSPPAPPRQPLWHSELHHSNWTRQSMNHSEIEWDIINDLRADMTRLQQGMSHMQRMLEACMDMQLELQRSVRQEVSAALNRSPEGQDGTDVSSIQKVVVGFKHFGRRNEESIAKLFITLLIKLSAVESLWPQGLCASLFEGSWIKKEWGTGIGNLSIEDFLDPSQNFARSVGQVEMKKISNCIKGSLKHLSRFMKGEIGEKKLREHLFGSFALNDSSDRITSEQIGLKRPIPFHEPDQANLLAAKRARYTEGTEELQHNFHSMSTSRPNPSIPLNKHAPFQTSRLEDHINPLERSHSGHGLQYQPEVPVPHPTSWPNPSLTLNPLALLQFSHGENHIYRFDHSQPSHEPHYQPQPPISPHLGYSLQYHSQRPISPPSVYSSQVQWQVPTASNPTSHGSDYHLGYRYPQDPFKPQSSFRIQHHESPRVPHKFSCILGHRQPDQHLQFPGIIDGRRENPWLGYSAQDLGVLEDTFVPQQQFNGPNYRFPHLPNL